MKNNTLHRDTEKRQAGYTLIELLLYVAIVGMLLASITLFFGIVADARVKNQTVSEVNDQAVSAMDYMTQTIRNASSITSPSVGTSGASLTLVVPTGSLSPTVFNLNGTTLQVKEGAASAVALTSSDVHITSLVFKNLTKTSTNGIVQISFTMIRANPNGRNEYDFQKTFTTSAEVAW